MAMMIPVVSNCSTSIECDGGGGGVVVVMVVCCCCCCSIFTFSIIIIVIFIIVKHFYHHRSYFLVGPIHAGVGGCVELNVTNIKFFSFALKPQIEYLH